MSGPHSVKRRRALLIHWITNYTYKAYRTLTAYSCMRRG